MMNWLSDSALASKKQQLKPTSTLITRADGVQYIESQVYASQTAVGFRGRCNNLNLDLTALSPGYVVDERPDLHLGLVTDHLLVGSIDAASDKDLLLKHRITHILSVAPLPHYKPPIDVHHLNLNILDLPSTELRHYYSDAFSFIDEAVASDGRVLVHCNAGVSRSAAITIAYLMQTMKISYDTAWEMVRKKRPSINPNIGFILQLKSFEEKLAAKE